MARTRSDSAPDDAGKIGTVTGEALGALLTQLLADPVIRDNAEKMGEALKAEDGPLNAHKAIERAVDSFRYPWPLGVQHIGTHRSEI